MQGAAGNQLLLLGCHEKIACGLVEKLVERFQVDGGVFFRGRHEHRALRHKRQAEIGLVVPERPEKDEVEVAPVRAEMLEQRGRVRTVLPKPLDLSFVRSRAVEHLIAEFGEDLHPPCARHRKTDDVHALLD